MASAMPRWAAVVAAPILKLRPAYFPSSMPAAVSTPFLKGSVLEALIRTCMVEGLAGISIVGER